MVHIVLATPWHAAMIMHVHVHGITVDDVSMDHQKPNEEPLLDVLLRGEKEDDTLESSSVLFLTGIHAW